MNRGRRIGLLRRLLRKSRQTISRKLTAGYLAKRPPPRWSLPRKWKLRCLLLRRPRSPMPRSRDTIPSLNGGTIDGSLRVFSGESFAINSQFHLNGDMYTVGTPNITVNSGASHGGLVDDGGNASPSNYGITLNSGVVLPGKIHRRANAQARPTDDGLPSGGSYSYQWTKVSGPGSVTFTDPTATATYASFSEVGIYVVRLTTSDSELTGSDGRAFDAGRRHQHQRADSRYGNRFGG